MSSCPDTARLQALLTGALADNDQEAVGRHVEECEACQRALEQLGATSWEEKARQYGPDETPADPALQEVMKQAVQQATQAESRDVEGHEDNLDYLSPSTRPGSLGRLGHYEIQEIIGKGGFGTVFKAFDEKLHRVVAIKVLSPAFAANGTARKRFIREAQAAAAVKNEHVVAIYNVEYEKQPPYLVMELIDGISLQDKVEKKGPLSVKEILRIGLQTAEGLAAAHKQGLVHRDIKPANILLENGVERVKITDFGLARAVDDASVTQSGVVAGTPMYMSPEQAEGLPIDHRSDLFSLGTVLYAMCTGHPPFRASGTHAVLKRVIDAAPRPIREINDEIPEWLCDIVKKLHAKQPEDRLQTAKEVAEVLGQRLADVQAGRAQPVVAGSPDPATGATPVVAGSPDPAAGATAGLQTPRTAGDRRSSPWPGQETGPQQAARPQRKGRWKWAAALLVLLVGLALAVTFFRVAIVRTLEGRGTIVFDFDDPELSVYVDDEMVIDWGKGPREIEVRPGTHRIRATKHGSAIHFHALTVERGSRYVVEIPQNRGSGAIQRNAPVALTVDRESRSRIWIWIGPGILAGLALVIWASSSLAKRFGRRRWTRPLRYAAGFMSLTAVVLGTTNYLWPRSATVVIEANDPEVQVTITSDEDGLSRSLSLSGTLRSKGEAEVPPGTYRLEVGCGKGHLLESVSIVEWGQATSYPGGQSKDETRLRLGPGERVTVAVRVMPLASAQDQQRIQGEWLGVSGEQQGKPLPLADVTKAKMTFAANGLAVSMPGFQGEGKFTLIANTTPKQIEVTRFEGINRFAVMKGIYKLEGDQLTICLGEPEDKITDFVSRAGSKIMLLVLKRAAELPAREAVIVTPEGGPPIVFPAGDISWADRVHSFQAGGRAAELTAGEKDPTRALGKPDGKWLALGDGGTLVLEFTDNVLLDGPGPDLAVFECGGEPIDPFKVAISADAQTWIQLGEIAKPPFTIDIGPFVKPGDRFRFVKITDLNGKVYGWPGADIDAVGAINTLPVSKTETPPLAVAPFDEKKAKEHQAIWAKHLGVEPELTNSLGMKLRLIPPGKNGLGASGPADSADAFFLGTTEVTVDQFRRFVEDEKYQTAGETSKLGGMRVHSGKKTERDAKYVWSHADFAPSGDHPVTLITWHDAMAFCAWLSRKEGRTYRLPTSAEWRWAERAGSAMRFYFGDTSSNIDAHAWHVGNSDMQAHAVGAKQGNPWGLFDVYGNVWELSYDWNQAGNLVDPILAKAGPNANDRVLFQGGGYSAPADGALEANGPPFVGYSHLGFRVALVGDLQAKTPPLAVPPPRTDDELLRGAWKATLISNNGFPLEKVPAEISVTFTYDGEKAVFETVGKEPLGQKVVLQKKAEGVLHLDDKKDPKRISLTTFGDKVASMLGIYRLEGNRLELCGDFTPKKVEYPASFATAAGSPLRWWVFERVVGEVEIKELPRTK